jgi:hypothetical protein
MDYMTSPGAIPGGDILQGFQLCANLVGDELEKVRAKFSGLAKKMDPSNPLSKRMLAVKEFDQFI